MYLPLMLPRPEAALTTQCANVVVNLLKFLCYADDKYFIFKYETFEEDARHVALRKFR